MADVYSSFPHLIEAEEDDYDELVSAFKLARLTTCLLLDMDDREIASRCKRSINEVERFMNIFRKGAAKELKTTRISLNAGKWSNARQKLTTIACLQRITTGDERLDDALGGGIPTQVLTEVAGESAVGKSNLLMQLAVSTQLPVEQGGLGRSAIYISTESGVETRRINDIVDGIRKKPDYACLDPDILPSSDRVHCVQCWSSEELVHVVKYQLAVAIERFNVGIIIIDSIAAPFRAAKGADRSAMLATIGRNLRALAKRFNTAVVLANQVRDRLPRYLNIEYDDDKLLYDEQLRWFSGWTAKSVFRNRPQKLQMSAIPVVSSSQTSTMSPYKRPRFESSSPQTPSSLLPDSSPSQSQHPLPGSQQQLPVYSTTRGVREISKTPTLGMLWSTLVDQRIVLKRSPGGDYINRTLETVFSPFVPRTSVNFEISDVGLHSLPSISESYDLAESDILDALALPNSDHC
jgi:DNA repair protein RAD57